MICLATLLAGRLLNYGFWFGLIQDSAWNGFLSSATMGLRYDKSVLAVAIFSMILQLTAIPIILIANKRR